MGWGGEGNEGVTDGKEENSSRGNVPLSVKLQPVMFYIAPEALQTPSSSGVSTGAEKEEMELGTRQRGSWMNWPLGRDLEAGRGMQSKSP